MRQAFWTAICAAVGWAATMVVVQPALAADLCVGSKPGCFAGIQAALDAAQDGDTIRIGPGTFVGGVTIRKDVALVGVSAGATRVEGGGPVITIGEVPAPDPPTVLISRVTITGGFNDSSPGPAFAAGGGVRIEPGAIVTIAESVVAGNRAAPKATFSDPAPCGSVPFDQCAFAVGGGIDNSGTLTVTDTRINDNVAGSMGVTSFAGGGGINNHPQGTVTLRHSFVTGNRVAVGAPNGRNTDGGGIVSSGMLTVEESVISGNSSEVAASSPSVFPIDFVEANAGGLYLAPGSSTTIRSSRISGNSVRSSNTAGDASAEVGGIDAEGSLLLVHSGVEGNTALAIVPASSGFLAETDGGGLQVRGSAVVRDSRISHNSISATSETGASFASGGGLANIGGSLTLERTLVVANSASATGLSGFNLGGGILNVLFGGGPPELTLTDSVVTANRLEASDGVMSQGGGLYTADPFSGTPFPVTLTRTVIAGNLPDQCVGC